MLSAVNVAQLEHDVDKAVRDVKILQLRERAAYIAFREVSHGSLPAWITWMGCPSASTLRGLLLVVSNAIVADKTTTQHPPFTNDRPPVVGVRSKSAERLRPRPDARKAATDDGRRSRSVPTASDMDVLICERESMHASMLSDMSRSTGHTQPHKRKRSASPAPAHPKRVCDETLFVQRLHMSTNNSLPYRQRLSLLRQKIRTTLDQSQWK